MFYCSELDSIRVSFDKTDEKTSDFFYNFLKCGYTKDKICDIDASVNVGVVMFIKQQFRSRLAQLLLNKCLSSFIGVPLESLESFQCDVLFS